MLVDEALANKERGKHHMTVLITRVRRWCIARECSQASAEQPSGKDQVVPTRPSP
jgi:hypothetical protein